jgi:WD40 repeat protein
MTTSSLKILTRKFLKWCQASGTYQFYIANMTHHTCSFMKECEIAVIYLFYFVYYLIGCINEMLKHVKSFVGHNHCVYSMAISPCGKYMASGSLDKTIRIW